MDELEILAPILLIIMAAAYRQYRRNKRKRRACWIKPWILRRTKHGAHHALLQELSSEDPENYRNFVRMTQDDFNELLMRVSPLILKKDTTMRESITPAERLSLTLRYIATGDSYKSMAFLYRIPSTTLSQIIPETCAAIYKCLKDEYMKVPDSPDAWIRIAKEFEERWNFPNCIGAMDGKHIALQCPIRSGSNYYNYKQFFSIVLLALVDADYKFIYVDCGCNGRVSDGGVFANSSLYEALETNSLNIPVGQPLPERYIEVPNVIVGDDAFPLKSYIMKPYPSKNLDPDKRIFNYRLSRARRIVENVFGILASRFAVLKRTIQLEPEKVENIVLACCALHNFLRSKKATNTDYMGPGSVDEEDLQTGIIQPGQWRQEPGTTLEGLSPQSGNRSSDNARDVRDELCDYFFTNGQVPWQWNLI